MPNKISRLPFVKLTTHKKPDFKRVTTKPKISDGNVTAVKSSWPLLRHLAGKGDPSVIAMIRNLKRASSGEPLSRLIELEKQALSQIRRNKAIGKK